MSRTELDFVVRSSPEQVVPYGEVTRIESSSGAEFDVLLSSSEDVTSALAGCNDGNAVRADSTFIATRR